MNMSDAERFTEIDKSKGEQIQKLASMADTLRNENIALRSQMERELRDINRQHEEELKLQEQEAMESIGLVRQTLNEQSEEMKKFGEFIKIQTESIKL
jgi:hypothetical protein